MLNIGLHGVNGHQIHGQLARGGDTRVRLAAVAAFPEKTVSELQPTGAAPFAVQPDLDALLAQPGIDLVVLCSPRRDRQAAEAIRCLEAGKHVYAEKPCALTEADLDRILTAAARSGRKFHEMAGTAFAQPYLGMRQAVADGLVGDVVQVLAQKSYPMHPGRPQDEGVDGGLILQAGVHAVRMIEHVAGTRVRAVEAMETTLGNPLPCGGLRVAASFIFRLGNGGVGSAVANYLNPRAFGSWGNEMLRIFGTAGMIEATDGGRRTRLVLADRDAGAFDTSAAGIDWFTAMVDEICDRRPMPLPLDEELSPLRVVIRARASAQARSR
jgi:predicted dehydrogenase